MAKAAEIKYTVTVCPWNCGAHWGIIDLPTRRHTVCLPSGQHEIVRPYPEEDKDTFAAVIKVLEAHPSETQGVVIGVCRLYCPVHDWIAALGKAGFKADYTIDACGRCNAERAAAAKNAGVAAAAKK